MTLSGCNKMQSSNCSCCETPFQWNDAFFTLFYMFQLSSIPSLPKFNLSCCVCDFSAVTFSYLFYVCSPWQLKIKLFYPRHDRFWHLVTSWYFETYLRWEYIHLGSPLVLFKAPGFRKMKSVLPPWLECHGVAPNPWLAPMFPVPSGFLSVWACVFQKVTRLAIEILAIQTGWDENAEWSNTLFGFQAPCGPRIRLSQISLTTRYRFVWRKFQLSCHVSFNPVPRSLMSQGSASWTVKVAGTTSPVLEDTAWSTAARSISQHLTAKQGCRQRSLHVCNLYIFRWKYKWNHDRWWLRSWSSSWMSLMFQLYQNFRARVDIELQASGEKLG